MGLFSSLAFASAVIPGFNTTVDGRNDDGTYTTGGCSNAATAGTCAGTLVPIGFNANFLGVTFNSVYVNTNGNVTFDSALAAFTPFGLTATTRNIIAPFFADVDTRNAASGLVSFGNGTFNGQNAFGVNWSNVGYYNSRVDKTNTFQLLLVDRSDAGVGDFDIVFNYDRVQFETGDAGGGIFGLGGASARVGFSNGTGQPATSFELAGSAIAGSLIDGGPNALISGSMNSSVLGQYLFTARNGVVTVPPSISIVPTILTVPEKQAINVDAPGLTAPGLTAPGLTTPGLTTPGAATPEPGTLFLLGSGAGLFLLKRKRSVK